MPQKPLRNRYCHIKNIQIKIHTIEVTIVTTITIVAIAHSVIIIAITTVGVEAIAIMAGAIIEIHTIMAIVAMVKIMVKITMTTEIIETFDIWETGRPPRFNWGMHKIIHATAIKTNFQP